MTVVTVILALLPLAMFAAWLAHDAIANKAVALERQQWADERRELLNRIKPETAQIGPMTEIVAPPAVPMDDDSAFWVSKERLAEHLAAEEIAA